MQSTIPSGAEEKQEDISSEVILGTPEFNQDMGQFQLEITEGIAAVIKSSPEVLGEEERKKRTSFFDSLPF